jgi:hypothetical protein
MPRYEVELQIDGTAWVDVEADDEAEAIDAAKDSLRLSDLGWWDVSDASTKEYAE